MKFKYMYMPFNRGKSIDSDATAETTVPHAFAGWVRRLIPAGRVIRIPHDAPDGFPIETREEAASGRCWTRVSRQEVTAHFGKCAIDELEDCEISMRAAEIPVDHWGRADEFENLVVEACEERIKTNRMVCPHDYAQATLNDLHYDPLFDVYHDDFNSCHYAELKPRDTKDGLPHTVTL